MNDLIFNVSYSKNPIAYQNVFDRQEFLWTNSYDWNINRRHMIGSKDKKFSGV